MNEYKDLVLTALKEQTEANRKEPELRKLHNK